MGRYWIAVASADHVRRGLDGGFMQVCHGKAGPLRRIRPGDRVAYYSPRTAFRGGESLKAFTAIGVVRDGQPYQADMGNGFCPFRRDVAWAPAGAAPIRPLLGRLEFAAGGPWGRRLRFGLVEVTPDDFALIAAAMGVRGLAYSARCRAACRTRSTTTCVATTS